MKAIKDFLVLDVETTGFTGKDQVIELAILDNSGETLYHALFKPDVKMNPIAQRKNKISESDLQKGGRFIEAWPEIEKIIKDRKVVGHNILKFDIPMIKQTLLAQGAKDTCLDSVFKDVVDSMIVAKKMGKKAASQEKLVQVYGIAKAEKHRAVADCQHLLKILDCMEKEISEDELRKILTEIA